MPENTKAQTNQADWISFHDLSIWDLNKFNHKAFGFQVQTRNALSRGFLRYFMNKLYLCVFEF
jgi:hypothetical protein